MAIALTTAATLSFFSHGASAQTPSPLTDWQYSAGVVLMPMLAPSVADWQIELGPAVAAQPLYPGSNQYRVQPGAVIDIRYKDLAFLSTGEGAGVNLLHGKGYRAGVAVGFDVGRAEGDSHLLRGMGNIAPAPTPKLFAEYVIFPLVIRLDFRRAIGGFNGYLGNLSVYLPVAGSEDFAIFIGSSLTFADDAYMGRYFGVTQSQARASGYPACRAGGGTKEVAFGASGNWFIAEHWLIDGDIAAKRLFDRAADSPLAHRSTGYVLGFALAYQY